MKSNGSRTGRGKFFHLFLALMSIFCTVVFCHFCTSPDVAYATESGTTDPKQQMVIKGQVFTEEKDAVKPDLILEQGNAVYCLVSAELKEVSVEGVKTYVSASVPYELEWQQNPPETTMITLYDEHTESGYKRELSCRDMKETEALWEKDFSFPITVSGYDAESFYIGNMVISKDKELIQYADHILESMGLSKEHYRINTITWSGEPYEKDGEIYREALAEGEKQVRRVDVTYGGEIKTPDTKGYQYISIYEIQEKGEDAKKSTNSYETGSRVEESNIAEHKECLAEQLHRFLQEHMTIVTVSSLFIIFVLGMVYLWWASKRKTKKQKSKELLS